MLIWALTLAFQQFGMCYMHCLRSACAQMQSNQSHCKLFAHSMSVKLLTEYHRYFKDQKGTAYACMSLHLSKCHIFGNQMSWFKYALIKNLSCLHMHAYSLELCKQVVFLKSFDFITAS